MEREKVRVKSRPVGIDSDIPSAPTLEDFYFDPGIAGIAGIAGSPTYQDPLGVAQFSAPTLTETIQQLDISGRGLYRTVWLMLTRFLFLVLSESAPPLSPPSAPTFPDLSDQLEYMNPHHKVVLALALTDAVILLLIDRSSNSSDKWSRKMLMRTQRRV